MDLEFVYTQMDRFISETGLMMKKKVMEDKYLKMVIIILVFGNKENTMERELKKQGIPFTKEIG